MAKKKTVKNAPAKGNRNSEKDYTFRNENMGAYRFDKDCYVSMRVNRTSLDVALGAIIDGETYTTTANLAGGSAGGSTMIKYNSDGAQSSDLEIVTGYPAIYVPTGANMYIQYNGGEWEPCTVADGSWISTSGQGGIVIEDNFVTYMAYSYDSTVKLLDGDSIIFKWEV